MTSYQIGAGMAGALAAAADRFRPDGSIATARLSSAGRPTPLTQVAIMASDGALPPRGSRGEIVARGPLVMAGYHRNPAATAEVSAHGWHHTGDIGYLDEDNFLSIVDRAKDMIITGGFNVYSAEVEQALQAFVKEQLGGVKAPKQVEVWPDLPRSKVGKVLEAEIRQRLSRQHLPGR